MSLLYHAYVYLEFLILACTIYILAPGKAILAVIVTLIVGYLGTVVGLELLGNWDEFGLLIAIAVMGAFIIYFNDKK